jgi:hypothetical protein
MDATPPGVPQPVHPTKPPVAEGLLRACAEMTRAATGGAAFGLRREVRIPRRT